MEFKFVIRIMAIIQLVNVYAAGLRFNVAKAACRCLKNTGLEVGYGL